MTKPKIPMKQAVSIPVSECESFGSITLAGREMNVTQEMLLKGNSIGKGFNGFVSEIVIDGMLLARKDIRVKEEADPLRKYSQRELDVIKHTKGCPYIVQYYGTFSQKNSSRRQISLFMERLPWSGMDLIRQGKEKPENGKIQMIPDFVIGRITTAVVHVLRYLKSKNVMQRDIKPSNILIDHDGRVKVCDFGICAMLENSIATTLIGTSQYNAPEKCLEKKCYTVKTDIWSLGITIYELATLEHPFLQPLNLYNAFMSKTPPILPDTYSKEIREFTRECLQIDPENRAGLEKIVSLSFFKEHNVPFEFLGTGLKPLDAKCVRRKSVGAWLDKFFLE